MTDVVVTRRERARAATIAEIKEAAFALMAESGTTDVRFTDIARVMGMTPPALYRYYADRDDLLGDLISDSYEHLGAAVAAARDAVDPADIGNRWYAAASAYREWARTQPQRFALVFGLPVPGYVAPEDGPTTEAAKRAMSQLGDLFISAAQSGQSPAAAGHRGVRRDRGLRRREAPGARGHRPAGELPGDAAGLGQPARLHLPGGLRPLRLGGRGGPRGTVPRARDDDRPRGRGARPPATVRPRRALFTGRRGGENPRVTVLESGKVAIVGAGSVGSSMAYACLMRGSARTIALYDVNEPKVVAEVLDLAHGAAFTGASEVTGGADPVVVDGAHVVVITAGAKQEPGQSRLDLAATNVALLQRLLPVLLERAPDAVFVLVTNPCDVLTVAAQAISGLPAGRVFSSGTTLDSSRLRLLLARRAGVSPGSVHANIIGEHGDGRTSPPGPRPGSGRYRSASGAPAGTRASPRPSSPASPTTCGTRRTA